MIDLKDLVADYEKRGMLKHINRRVSSENEMMAVLKASKGELPMCFHHVDDYKYPVISGMGGSREMLAYSMGIPKESLRNHLAKAIVNPIPVTRVSKAPCQENEVYAPFDLDKYFPVLRHYEKDNGRFIISGMLLTKDITGKKVYTSIRRMWYMGQNKMTLLITSDDMKEQLAWYEERKEPMEIALMIGVVPGIVLGSQISTHLYQADKLEVSGALMGESLKVVPCKTVNLEVLANAQVVLEGKVYPWKRQTEGPFGEMAFYYGKVSELPVCEFSCMTFQNNPLWYTFFPSGSEEKIPMAISREVNLYRTIFMTVPGVKDVHLTLAGQGRYHAIVQIYKKKESDGIQAALSAFASDKDLKYVVVVDQDVDIWNSDDVEWAIATRTQADKDFFIIPGADGSPLEASHNLRGYTAKMGIDATAPLGDQSFERTHVIGEEKISLSDYIEEVGKWH